jgi:hypothetical protein
MKMTEEDIEIMRDSSKVLQWKLEILVSDLKELNQTDVACYIDGYEIKITKTDNIPVDN